MAIDAFTWASATPVNFDLNHNVVEKNSTPYSRQGRKSLKRVTFNTWTEPPQHSPQYQQEDEAHHQHHQQPTYQQPAAVQEAAVAPQSFAGSYSHNSNSDISTKPAHNPSQPRYGSAAAPLPVIPDEDEEVTYERAADSESDHTMTTVAELYPSHSSPRIRRAQNNDIPPVVNRRSKPAGGSPSKPPAPYYQDSSRPALPAKPTVDYSRKPIIEDPPPHPTRPSDNDSYEKPVGRMSQRSNAEGGRVEPVPRPNQNQPAVRPDTMNLNQPLHTRDHHDHYNQHTPSLYEEIPHVEVNIRGRYPEIGAGRPFGADLYNSRNDDEEVERRKFRQMQPVPHQYYIDHAGGRSSGEPSRDRGLSVRGSDPNLLRERSSSSRSFASLSSSDSLDDKNLPIRIPGRRHLSSDTPSSDPPTPVTPMSLREASRLMPQGLVNPSYRVATMTEDMVSPAPAVTRPVSSRRSSRPTPSRRQGGLPGHVRQGIVQGRKMLSDAANDSSPAVNDSQAMKRPPAKSETAV